MLNEFFHNVCELDLVFNFYKVLYFIFNEFALFLRYISNYHFCININAIITIIIITVVVVVIVIIVTTVVR